MNLRLITASAFALLAGCWLPVVAPAQVVRFETSVGEFDMVLNPTRDARLQSHTDNLLGYVDSLTYNCSVINRADEDFVLQMGGFMSRTLRPPTAQEGFISLETVDPVIGAPAATTGLSNARGTVALALPGDGLGGTNRNAGTSSFFVNLGDNSFLDPDFTVFAVIPDLTVIDRIMALDQTDLTDDFGISPGNLGFSDVPLQDDGNLVFIQRAFVLEDAMATSMAVNAALDLLSGITPTLDPSSSVSLPLAAAAGLSTPVSEADSATSLATPASATSSISLPLSGASSASGSASGSAAVSVPEPAALALMVVGMLGCLGLTRRR